MAWPLAARVSTAGRPPAAGRIGLAGPRLLAAQIVEDGLLGAVDVDHLGSAGGAADQRYVAGPDPDSNPHARPSGLLERTCLSCGRGGTRLRDRIRLCPAWPGRRWIGGRPCPARAAFSPGDKGGGR